MSKLYFDAAQVLAPCLTAHPRSGASSLKSRTFSDSIANKKSTHLLVCETLKHRKLLDVIMEEAKLGRIFNSTKNKALLYVLLYELLIGKNKTIKGGGSLKRILLEHESKLRITLDRILKKSPEFLASNNLEMQESKAIPRYCRINKLQPITLDILQKEFGESIRLDPHISGLIQLPPQTDLHDHQFVKSGQLILQDKSSCFPVAALSIQIQNKKLTAYDAIDCCAAPGNKTSQLAGEIEGKIFAFEKSESRFKLLKRRMDEAGCENRVFSIHGDFLKVDPKDSMYKNVRVILLDPSCSGSGSFSVDRISEKLKESDERIEKLSNFQLQVLSHALSFKQATIISYSTCSVFFREKRVCCPKSFRTTWLRLAINSRVATMASQRRSRKWWFIKGAS